MTENDAAHFIMTSVTVAGGLREVLLQQNQTNTATPPTTIPERVLGRTEYSTHLRIGGAGQTPLSWMERKVMLWQLSNGAGTWHSLL